MQSEEQAVSVSGKVSNSSPGPYNCREGCGTRLYPKFEIRKFKRVGRVRTVLSSGLSLTTQERRRRDVDSRADFAETRGKALGAQVIFPGNYKQRGVSVAFTATLSGSRVAERKNSPSRVATIISAGDRQPGGGAIYLALRGAVLFAFQYKPIWRLLATPLPVDYAHRRRDRGDDLWDAATTTGVRQRAMRLHRWTRRVYLGATTVGIVGAFLMAVYSTPRSFGISLNGAGNGVDPDDGCCMGGDCARGSGIAQGMDDPVVSGGVRVCDVAIHQGFVARGDGEARIECG
jgi:hypothetical protein